MRAPICCPAGRRDDVTEGNTGSRCHQEVALASHRLPVTTALFLFTTALTSVTGFLFPIHGLTLALQVGILACFTLAVALFALYKGHLVKHGAGSL
jgi:hypothetical protein